MLDSEDNFRGPAPRPYRPNRMILSVPGNALETTLQMLRRARRLECCVFWYGPRSVRGGDVKGVYAPQQKMTWGNYHVDPAAMSEMLSLVPDDWKPLAQIHCHPGKGVEHSRYDDEMASSKRALSIVFPFYGQWAGAWPQDVGVHEWQDDYWHLLPSEAAAARVRLTGPAAIDGKDLRR